MDENAMIDDEPDPQDKCFAFIRMITAVILEYSPHIRDEHSRAAWAITDLRSINQDLLQAAMDGNYELSKRLISDGNRILVAFYEEIE